RGQAVPGHDRLRPGRAARPGGDPEEGAADPVRIVETPPGGRDRGHHGSSRGGPAYRRGRGGRAGRRPRAGHTRGGPGHRRDPRAGAVNEGGQRATGASSAAGTTCGAEGTWSRTTAVQHDRRDSMTEGLDVIIVTGLSGAGRSTAAKCLEDLGYFVVDNLPPELITTMVDLGSRSEGAVTRIAVVMDVRSRAFSADLRQVI